MNRERKIYQMRINEIEELINEYSKLPSGHWVRRKYTITELESIIEEMELKDEYKRKDKV